MGAVAALVTWLSTFVVRRLAVRFSIIDLPDDRRVHERPTPTLGGTGMYLGLLAAMVVASQIRGTGLGLAIAKRSAEAFGGTLSVESQIGVGSVFTLRLPAFDQPQEEFLADTTTENSEVSQ